MARACYGTRAREIGDRTDASRRSRERSYRCVGSRIGPPILYSYRVNVTRARPSLHKQRQFSEIRMGLCHPSPSWSSSSRPDSPRGRYSGLVWSALPSSMNRSECTRQGWVVAFASTSTTTTATAAATTCNKALAAEPPVTSRPTSRDNRGAPEWRGNLSGIDGTPRRDEKNADPSFRGKDPPSGITVGGGWRRCVAMFPKCYTLAAKSEDKQKTRYRETRYREK